MDDSGLGLALLEHHAKWVRVEEWKGGSFIGALAALVGQLFGDIVSNGARVLLGTLEVGADLRTRAVPVEAEVNAKAQALDKRDGSDGVWIARSC
jgi:hypothetical protein